MLDGLGIKDYPVGIDAAGALLIYLTQTQILSTARALAMDLQILPLMIIRVTQHLRMKMNLQMSIMIAY